MNKDAAIAALPYLALPFLALLAACNMGAGGNASSGDSEQGELTGARIGAPFTLTNQDGKPTKWDDFKGQYRLVYFGYTYCPDV
ncbi:MAG: SCO family protein, partial [Sphingobium limneticum]